MIHVARSAPPRPCQAQRLHASFAAVLLAIPLVAASSPVSAPVSAPDSTPDPAGYQATNFADLSLEELNDFRVTSVSRKEERLADAAASVYVITADAIRHAGVRTLPEALRLAPNLLVAQINSFQYAISARGHNGVTSNKLLVMIDGRAIYTPLYAGVFWDAQDVMMADVERIEVVSGPGGTIWGTNAVNGVINIIMRPAGASRGDLVQLQTGQSGNSGNFRHGGSLGDIAYAVYAKADSGRRSKLANGGHFPDAWAHGQVGFRAEWRQGGDQVSLYGDAYRSSGEQTTGSRAHLTGGNLIAHWERALADGAGLRVHTYFDRTTRAMPGTLNEQLNTYDLDVQYRWPELAARETIVGGGYRLGADRVGNSNVFAFLPGQRKLHWGNLFAQHELRWGQADSQKPPWRLTMGLRMEANDDTGVEWLPSLKLAWHPQPDSTGWLTLARSVRAPSRIDTDFYYPAVPPYQYGGGKNFQAETASTVELGWRKMSAPGVTWSLVGFHTQYQRLRSIDLQGRSLVIGNQVHGYTQGLEAQASYALAHDWSLESAATLLHQQFRGGLIRQTPQGNDPNRQLRLGLNWRPGTEQDWHATVRHVGKLPSPAVPSYTVLDLQWGWRPGRNTELTVAARNLLDRRHREFNAPANQPGNTIMLGRVVDVVLTARF